MKKLPIFYNALMLTGVNLLLRVVSTSFQVFISARIGAAGVGLLQLVLSVAGMALTAGIAGIRTATMYLTAEELGCKRQQNVTWVLSGCFLYSLLFSGGVGALTFGFAPKIAADWIGDIRTLGAIRLFAVFLPVSCMTGVMTGYFTAAGRIGTLAAVEVAEQLCSMAVTTAALPFWAGSDIGRACQAVILGSCAGGLLTLCSLVILRLLERPKTGKRIPVARRLGETALPLAVADDLKVGINTVENLMVPKRLALFTTEALAQFGIVGGMVFPVLMFPAGILYGLSDLLIPELARCNAAGSHIRIRYLARRSLRVALVYGIACGGVLFLLADVLCLGLYRNEAAGEYLRWFALLAPMLYCDAIIDAMNKGLGQQKICVRYNILTSAMDVALLFLWLPKFGMKGYFASFLITHVINAALSLRLLLKNTGLKIPLRTPITAAGSLILAVLLAERIGNLVLKTAIFLAAVLGLLYGSGILYQEDALWLRGLWKIRKNTEKKQIK
jgi:stage V sporulation protein B